MQKSITIDTPVGVMRLTEEDGYLVSVSISEAEKCSIDLSGICCEEGDPASTDNPVLMAAAIQMQEYFCGKRKEFDLPIAPKGTEFQLRVWEALRQIPYGETRTYKEMAESVGNPKACRAVGGANNRNPLIIITPCHRVIGADGKLVGFAAGIGVKEALLEHERAVISGDGLRLDV